ncbi:MAG: HlyD family secretion protein [Syntrophomonadaceae bacterium]|jgi:HlyD family secretion protein|nr:HlyD family efflux transporter periplasmic adaptor subunit [Syntrophomonadaceae bacterium]
MQAKRVIIPILLLGLIGWVAYWAYYHYYQPPLQSLEASGTIEAESVELSARISGTLISLGGEEGSQISKGQLAAEISRPDLLAQRDRDALSVAALEARLQDLQSGARSQEIKEASIQVEMAAANLKQLETDLQRIQHLYEAGAVSQSELEQQQLKRDNLLSQLEAARARLNLLQAGSRPELIEAAAAELERSQAVLKASEAQLEDLKLYSPIEGIISKQYCQVGEYVQMGSPLLQIIDVKNMWIKVYIPTDDLPQIKLKQKASIRVSGSERVFTGTVIHIATQGEFTPKTIQTKKERTNVVYAVKLSVDDQSGTLKPGMPADVVFHRGEADD